MPRSQSSRRNLDLGLSTSDNPLKYNVGRLAPTSSASTTDTRTQRRLVIGKSVPVGLRNAKSTDVSNAIVNSINRRVSRRLDVALKKVDVALKQIPAPLSGPSGAVLVHRKNKASRRVSLKRQVIIKRRASLRGFDEDEDESLTTNNGKPDNATIVEVDAFESDEWGARIPPLLAIEETPVATSGLSNKGQYKYSEIEKHLRAEVLTDAKAAKAVLPPVPSRYRKLLREKQAAAASAEQAKNAAGIKSWKSTSSSASLRSTASKLSQGSSTNKPTTTTLVVTRRNTRVFPVIRVNPRPAKRKSATAGSILRFAKLFPRWRHRSGVMDARVVPRRLGQARSAPPAVRRPGYNGLFSKPGSHSLDAGAKLARKVTVQPDGRLANILLNLDVKSEASDSSRRGTTSATVASQSMPTAQTFTTDRRRHAAVYRGVAGSSNDVRRRSLSETPRFHLPHLSSSSSASTLDVFTDDCLTTEDIRAWHDLKFMNAPKLGFATGLAGLPHDIKRLLDKAPNFTGLRHISGDKKRLILEALRRHKGGFRASPSEMSGLNICWSRNESRMNCPKKVKVIQSKSYDAMIAKNLTHMADTPPPSVLQYMQNIPSLCAARARSQVQATEAQSGNFDQARSVHSGVSVSNDTDARTSRVQFATSETAVSQDAAKDRSPVDLTPRSSSPHGATASSRDVDKSPGHVRQQDDMQRQLDDTSEFEEAEVGRDLGGASTAGSGSASRKENGAASSAVAASEGQPGSQNWSKGSNDQPVDAGTVASRTNTASIRGQEDVVPVSVDPQTATSAGGAPSATSLAGGGTSQKASVSEVRFADQSSRTSVGDKSPTLSGGASLSGGAACQMPPEPKPAPPEKPKNECNKAVTDCPSGRPPCTCCCCPPPCPPPPPCPCPPPEPPVCDPCAGGAGGAPSRLTPAQQRALVAYRRAVSLLKQLESLKACNTMIAEDIEELDWASEAENIKDLLSIRARMKVRSAFPGAAPECSREAGIMDFMKLKTVLNLWAVEMINEEILKKKHNKGLLVRQIERTENALERYKDCVPDLYHAYALMKDVSNSEVAIQQLFDLFNSFEHRVSTVFAMGEEIKCSWLKKYHLQEALEEVKEYFRSVCGSGYDAAATQLYENLNPNQCPRILLRQFYDDARCPLNKDPAFQETSEDGMEPGFYKGRLIANEVLLGSRFWALLRKGKGGRDAETDQQAQGDQQNAEDSADTTTKTDKPTKTLIGGAGIDPFDDHHHRSPTKMEPCDKYVVYRSRAQAELAGRQFLTQFHRAAASMNYQAMTLTESIGELIGLLRGIDPQPRSFAEQFQGSRIMSNLST